MKIYITYRNADMTEGRGPMVPDLVFSTLELAKEYIDNQPGVMGRRARWSEEKYGDWKIEVVDVLRESPKDAKIRKERLKKAALNKLTEEEKEALELI